MSHRSHISLSVDSNMAGSLPDPFSKLFPNKEEDSTETIYENIGVECSTHNCIENGVPHDLDKSSKNVDRQQNISNSKCLDTFKIESLVKDSDKNTKTLLKCNGISHSDHISGDSSYIISLNSCSKESFPTETSTEVCNCHSDTINPTEINKHCNKTDPADLSVEELQLNEKQILSVHQANRSEVDILLTELERTTPSSYVIVENNSGSCVITYEVYESEKQMPDIMRLITKDLSEPYSIYTYRYFIHNWPKLCFLAMANNVCVGAIVCKLDLHKKMVRRGYIAMLAVDSEYRRRQIGSSLVTKAIEAMIRDDCDEVVLETEITNQAALHLYENLGFVRDKRLFRYYLNGVDALRLKLWLR
ncbi:N-alpha-acetyltransferase 30 [Biomphalaria glabrata]|nr:N-alpha-acetyltransferase 30 [Biomphalaria glabrata]KAI8746757.1 N-alpha-acetyltransferase 30-like [Biomphalaria glabrata]